MQLIPCKQLALYGMKVLSQLFFCYYSFTQPWRSERDPLNLN